MTKAFGKLCNYAGKQRVLFGVCPVRILQALMPGAWIRGLLKPWGEKMGWDPEIPICLRIVYGSFHATMVELVHCYRLYGP